MPTLCIDNREVTVPDGATLLDAARALGIDVPTLCFCEGLPPNTTCMVCVMKVRNGANANHAGKLVPACATLATDGMTVDSDTAEVYKTRRMSLDLLLSDHASECSAPCQFADRFNTDIPRMIRAIAEDRLAEAIAVLRQAVPLAGVLTRTSRENSEGGCRRLVIDEAVGIGPLKRYVADKDLAAPTSYSPPCEPATGKRVAIVGAGPAGLSAAYFLLQKGNACTLIEKADAPGGSLNAVSEGILPRDVLAREIELIRKLGAAFELGSDSVTADAPVDRGYAALLDNYDAVLIATGKSDAPVPINKTTHETETPGVFAAGDVVRPHADPARAAASGKSAAVRLDQYLRGVAIAGEDKLFALGVGRPGDDEIASLMSDTNPAARVAGASLSDADAGLEAQRCMHCDCRSLSTCKLRIYAQQYGADAKRFKGARRKMERITTHPEIVYEPGKCILCGICVQLAEKLREPFGLTHVGRGFDLKIATPFDESLGKCLREAARKCVENCPTGALAWKTEDRRGE